MLNLQTSIATKSLARKSGTPDALFASHLPYVSVLNDRMLMSRDGDLIASFLVDGYNADTSDERHVNEFSKTLSRLIAQQHEPIGYYIHRLSFMTKPRLSPVSHNKFTNIIDQKWQHYLQNSGLRNRISMVSLTLRPSKVPNALKSLFGKKTGATRNDFEARAKRLDRIVSMFVETLSDAHPQRLHVSEGTWLGLLKFIVSGNFVPFVPGSKFVPISDLIATTDIKFDQDSFVVFGDCGENMRVGAIATIKDYPTTTYAGILDRLNLPFDTVVTQSFTPTDNIKAQGKISRIRRQMSAADDAAVSLQLQLEEAEDNVASGRSVFGDHQATISTFCKDDEDLDRAMTMVSRAVQETGGALVRESLAARAAYFAQHPGNYSYRTRPAMISSVNFAHLAALHGTSRGRPSRKSPWGEAVTVLPTARGEPYRFNFHLAGKHNERTVGHSLVLGQTGSGKTLGIAFLLSQALRLGTRIIVFDKDNGFEMAIRALDGNYSPVRAGKSTGLNPFNAESDDRGTAWLNDWLKALAESKSSPLHTQQIESLNNAVSGNKHANLALQNFSSFRSQLRSTDDDGDLYSRFSQWDLGGRYGWLFDGKEQDSLAFDNMVTAFDLTEIFDQDVIRTAWLSYVFRRIERLVEDERPTLLVLDEAWKLLDDPYFQVKLKDWMLTMRKKNVAVILLTQRVSHIMESLAGNSILESAVTRMVYPSSFNTPEELAPLNLTSNELSFLQTSNVGNHLVLVKSGSDSVVLDFNLAPIRGGIDVLGGGKGTKAKENWREDPNFWLELM